MATDFSNEAAQDIIDRMRAGTAPWQKPWEPGQLRSAYNISTGKPYRGFNQIWLSLRGRGDPRWVTYNQAAALGGQVRKGEKSTTIEYWQWSKDEPARDDNGKILKDDQGQTIMRSVELERPRRFTARVFNAEQIDGLEPLPPSRFADEIERHSQAEAILALSPAPIRHIEGDRAYYEPKADRITLPMPGQFRSPDLYYATAFHELGHSSGHESRLNRDLSNGFGTEGYAREELVAEIASYMMAQRMGIAFDPGHHVAYVGSWLNALEKDPREIFRAAAEAEKVVEWVIGLEREVEVKKDLGLDQTVAGLDAALAKIEQESAALRLEAEVNASLDGRAGETSGLDQDVREQVAASIQARDALWQETSHPLAAAHSRLVAEDRLGLVGADFAKGRDDAMEDEISYGRQYGVPAAHIEVLVGLVVEAQEGRDVTSDLAAFAGISDAHSLIASSIVRSHLGVQSVPEWSAFQPGHDPAQVEQRFAEAMVRAEVEKDRAASNGLLDGWRLHGPDSAQVTSEMLASWTGVEERHGRLAIHAAEVVHAFAAIQSPGQPLTAELEESDKILAAFARGDEAHQAVAGRLLFDLESQIGPDLQARLSSFQAREAAEREYAADQVAILNDRAAGDGRDDDGLDEPAHESGRPLAKEKTVTEKAAPILSTERVDLTVPYSEKNQAKAAGAKWDKDAKTWYAPKGTDLAALALWTKQIEALPLSPEEEFKQFLESKGFKIKGLPVMDGTLQRVPIEGDRQSQQGAYQETSGAYVGYTDDHPAGFWQNHRLGIKENWKSQQRTQGLAPEERARLDREAAAKQAERDAIRQHGYEVAADGVQQIIEAAVPVVEGHRYLANKAVSSLGVYQMKETALMPPGSDEPMRFGNAGDILVPARDMDGRLWTAQAIAPNGRKSFPKGARLNGCSHLIGGPVTGNDAPVLVVEGWATGKTVHELTGQPVAVAFNANNLEVVARGFRAKFPDKAIIILGDNDHRKEAEIDPATNRPKPNVGKEKAIAAAQAVAGHAFMPPFNQGDKGTDWNDYAAAYGASSAQQLLEEKLAVVMRRELTSEITANRDIDRQQPEQEREREVEQGRGQPDRETRAKDRDRSDERPREPALSMGR